jgi:hypothetical protein
VKEAELRERFDEWAAPLRAAPPPAFGSIRRRSRARMGRLAAAAGSTAAAVALVIALVVGGAVSSPRPANPWGSARYPAPPSQPYVFVNVSLGPIAQVRDAATGAVLATLRTPGETAVFGAAAAAPSDRLFVVSESVGGPGGSVTLATVRIVAAAHGHAAPAVRLSPVPHLHLPTGAQVNDMVVNAAGTRVALEWQNSAGAISLSIYNLASGSLIGSWQAPTLQPDSPLQFLPDGDLAVAWQQAGAVTSPASGQQSPSPTGSQTPPASPGGPVQISNRVVNPAVPFPAGSSFVADSLADPALLGTPGTLSADGTVLLSVSQAPTGGTADVVGVSEVTGMRLFAVPIGPGSDLNNSEVCGVLWASANGQDLLTQCGSQQEEIVDGQATVVRLAWKFPYSQVQGVMAFAW